MAQVSVNVANPSGGTLEFRRMVIERGFYGDDKAVGDIDGDGFTDGVVGRDQLAWYRYPNWTRSVIANADVEFTTDMQVGDVDGDGDLDAIVADGSSGNNVIWLENPRPGGNPATGGWVRHVIGSHGDYAHGIEVADVDDNGQLDVVTRKGDTQLFLQTGANSWTRRTISARQGEGTALGDIDRDGDIDVALNGYWLEAPSDPLTGNWVERVIDADWPTQVGVHIADLNADGRPDVVLAHTESVGRMAWYEAPADPRTGAWQEHSVDGSVDFVHTIKTADMDNNGTLDIVFAEKAQSSRKRVGIYLNTGGGLGWDLVVLATTESHNIRVADIGNDGDVDIVGANWQGPPVELWENLLVP